MTWKPNRTMINFVIDAVGLVLMLSMVCTGLLIRFVLPPGSTGRHGGRALTLWGMDRHDWGALHFWLAVALLGLLLLHVALHWSWVCGLWQRWRCADPGARRGARALSGAALVLGLALLVGGFLWWSAASVEERLGPRSAASALKMGSSRSPADRADRALDGSRASIDHAEGDETVRGSMTLREVADATGVPVDHLRSSLGLPADTLDSERMGRLRRRFGFRMDDVRRAVAAYRSLRSGEG
jgi:hypothetical protein